MKGVSFTGILDVSTDERDEVVVIDKFFSISDLFAARTDGIEFGGTEGVAQMLQAGSDGGTAAVFGQREFGFAPAHDLRVDDFIGFPFFENAVLMNPRAMGKGVETDDRFISGDGKTART